MNQTKARERETNDFNEVQ